MKKLIQFSLLLMAVLLYSGCKKDKTIDPAVYGLWQVVETQVPNLSYVRFNNNKTLEVFFETPTGFKTKTAKNYTPGTDQIIASFFSDTYYPPLMLNYTVQGDILTLTGDNGIVYIKATRSASAAPDTWVTEVTPSDQINNLFTDNDHGIGFDGTNLLFVNYNPGIIYKVSLTTDTIIEEINSDVNSLNTVEFDGSGYWVASNGSSRVYKVNGSGTEIFNCTETMGPWLYGLGYISTMKLICYSHNDETLYSYAPGMDVVTAMREVPGAGLRDMAIANGKIYIHNYTTVYRLNADNFNVEKAYLIKGAQSISGIASVGGNTFWLNTNNGTQILKVELN